MVAPIEFICTETGLIPSAYVKQYGLVLSPSQTVKVMKEHGCTPVLRFVSDGSIPGMKMVNRLKTEFGEYLEQR